MRNCTRGWRFPKKWVFYGLLILSSITGFTGCGLKTPVGIQQITAGLTPSLSLTPVEPSATMTDAPVVLPSETPTSSATAVPSATPSLTPVPPTPSPTFTPTFTPTLTQTVAVTDTSPAEQLVEWSHVVLMAGIANRMELRYTWGRGTILDAVSVPQVKIIIVRTPWGIYLYRRDDLETIGFLEEAQDFLVSPNNKLLATIHADGIVKLWRLEDAKLLYTFAHEVEIPRYPPEDFNLDQFLAVTMITFSHNGQRLAVGYGDRKIALWDVETGYLQSILTQVVAPQPLRIIFSKDDQYLASSDGNLGIWRLEDEHLLIRIPYAGTLSDAPFSPDNLLIATYETIADRALVWRISDGRQLYHIGIGTKDAQVSFSQDGQYLIINQGEQIRHLPEGNGVSLKDAGISLPPVSTPEVVDLSRFTFQGHFRDLRGVQLLADNSLFAWGIDSQRPVWWDVQNDFIGVPDIQNPSVDQVIAQEDGSHLFICNGGKLWSVPLPEGPPLEMNTCRPGSLIVQSEVAGLIARSSGSSLDFLWRSDGMLKNNLQGHLLSIQAMAFSADGRYFASGSQSLNGQGMGEVIAWQTDSPARLFQGEHPYGITGLAFSPDNRLLITVGNGHVRVWDVAKGKLIKFLKGDASVLTFSPDGRLLAFGYPNGDIHLFEVETMSDLVTLTGHRGAVVSIVFSSDGANLFSASTDGTIKWWSIP